MPIIIAVVLQFARHGESEANRLGIFANSIEGYGLTELGRQEANALASDPAIQNVSAVFASPLLRSQQTAQIVCDRLRVPMEIRAALTEFSVGVYEGCAVAGLWNEYAQIESRWLVDGDAEARLGGGECLEEIRSRFGTLIAELIERFANSDSSVLLVGHGGTLSCALPAFLENVSDSFSLTHRIPHCGIIRVVSQGRKLVCTDWAGTIPDSACSVAADQPV